MQTQKGIFLWLRVNDELIILKNNAGLSLFLGTKLERAVKIKRNIRIFYNIYCVLVEKKSIIRLR